MAAYLDYALASVERDLGTPRGNDGGPRSLLTVSALRQRDRAPTVEPRPEPSSAAFLGDVESSAHGSPYPLGVDSGLQSTVHRAATEFGEYVVLGQRGGSDRAELLVHSLPEMGYSHSCRLGAPAERYPVGVLAQTDPTGLSSPTGQLVILFGLLAALAVLIRWWWQQRGR